MYTGLTLQVTDTSTCSEITIVIQERENLQEERHETVKRRTY